MRLPDDNEINRPSINILPMIDVIFAILAFFILSTLSLTRAEGFSVNLPQAVTASPQDQIDVMLVITSEGDLSLGDKVVLLEDLADEVRAIAPTAPVLVTIRADESTSHGRVVAAMDQLRTIDRVRLGIATTRP